MNENISALMDGELNAHDASILINQLSNTDGLREHWAAYHLIGDAMKQAELAPFDVTRRVSARLAMEPPLQAMPSPVFAQQGARKQRHRPVAFAAAASIAAMVVGGWMSLQMSQSSDPRQQNLADNRPAFVPAVPAGTSATPSTPSVATAPSIPAGMAVTVSAPA